MRCIQQVFLDWSTRWRSSAICSAGGEVSGLGYLTEKHLRRGKQLLLLTSRGLSAHCWGRRPGSCDWDCRRYRRRWGRSGCSRRRASPDQAPAGPPPPFPPESGQAVTYARYSTVQRSPLFFKHIVYFFTHCIRSPLLSVGQQRKTLSIIQDVYSVLENETWPNFWSWKWLKLFEGIEN